MVAVTSPVRARKFIVRGIAAVLASGLTLGIPAVANAKERNANPATFSRVFDSARAGDVIRLSSGGYGTFRGAMKPGEVTITRQPQAHVTMQVDFNPAANITISGVTLTYAHLADSRTHDIIIRNADVPGQVWISGLYDSDVVLARNDFHDFEICSTCAEGRVYVTGGDQPSGVSIKDSRFYGGLSDGIQNGSYGTKIIGNEFYEISPGSSSGVHADAIQLYGSSHTVIRGNYMHDLPDVPFIMAGDGADHELIEDNVFAGSSGEYPFITLFSDDSSIVRHNTFSDGDCVFDIRCGVLRLDALDGDDPGRRTIVKDNILSSIAVEGPTTLAERSHNLLAHQNASGPGEIRGLPTYAGGASPRSYRGFRLKSGSRGFRRASDGLNMGARISP